MILTSWLQKGNIEQPRTNQNGEQLSSHSKSFHIIGYHFTYRLPEEYQAWLLDKFHSETIRSSILWAGGCIETLEHLFRISNTPRTSLHVPFMRLFADSCLLAPICPSYSKSYKLPRYIDGRFLTSSLLFNETMSHNNSIWSAFSLQRRCLFVVSVLLHDNKLTFIIDFTIFSLHF